MSDSFIGEIKIFGGNYAPMDWSTCNGQLLPINQNTALFSLINTFYGGDGIANFKLPDLRGRIPIHMGTGPGLSSYYIGESFGTEQETIDSNTLPSHTHNLVANSTNANAVYDPTGKVLCQTSSGGKQYASSAGTQVGMNTSSVTSIGGDNSHDNMMPSLCLNFIIALYGYYPSRD